jgi:hypothetical protein
MKPIAITWLPQRERPPAPNSLGTAPTNGTTGCRRERPPIAWTFLAIVGTAGLAVLGTACGGPSGRDVAQLGSTTTQSSQSSQRSAASGQESAVAFARCMRSHGVPGWPDPNSYGGFDKSKLTQQQLGAGKAQVGAAQRSCQHLLPTISATQQQTQRIVAQALRFSRCMRNHGITNFPDPDSNGGIRIPESLQNNGGPRYEAALKACQPFPPPPVVRTP